MKPQLVIIVILLGLSTGKHSPAAEPRPNILVIMTDEHHAGVMGCDGNRLARTPNLDGLAAKGVRFSAHYCASPICTPSRQTFTTGKYVSGHRVWSNTPGVPEGTPSLARILNAAGYESFLDGKMHYKGGMTHGYATISEKDGTITLPKRAEDFASTPAKQKPRSRLPAGEFRDQGSEVGAEFDHVGQANPLDTFVDAARRKHAVQFLKERKPDAKPFFLTVGFIAPHYPLEAPAEYLDHFKDKVPQPIIPDGYLEKLPLNYRLMRNDRKLENVPPETVKAAMEGYYARVEWIDDQIGQVLRALEQSPFADDTVVIYTSDHGENLGEHGLWWKNSMYDCAARVPLIISWPKRWRGDQHRAAACGMVDLVQTIAALGGAEVPADWKGESMLPWLDDEAFPWRDLAVSEYFGSYVASGFAMIRQGDWKYVYHTRADASHGPERELFNLRTDSREMENLAGDPAQRKRLKDMHDALVKETGEDPEVTEANWRAGMGPLSLTEATEVPIGRNESTPKSSGQSNNLKRLRAKDVYSSQGPVIFQDDFASGSFERWKLSQDDRYGLTEVDTERLAIVEAPNLGEGRKAVQFVVERQPNVFRSEIALPHEEGFQERWYAARILIPHDWKIDETRGGDILMQWHAIPGNWRATFPNLAISVDRDRWKIQQSFGSAQTKPTRTTLRLDEAIRPGEWTSWVVHAKWSPGSEGKLRIWKDSKLIIEREGPNVYGTIGVEYTPYLKTGIYHPEWHLESDAARQAFEAEQPSAKRKVVFVTDIKVGNELAMYDDVAPQIAPAATSASEKPTSSKKPNILFVFADNWRWPNAGILGDSLAKTPTFDRITREGVLFTHTFNPVPSCSPTRACLLTGKYAHQLGERASLWSAFPQDTPVVTDLMRQAGYQTGFAGKGWGPGNFEVSGWKENPVGTKFDSFSTFVQQRDESKPFFFWLGNTDTATRGGQHPYLETAQIKLDADKLVVPPELPDCPEVRRDLLNYYGGIMKLDEQAAEAVGLLEKMSELDDTIVVFASDNGWQLPRGLANCYDSGSRVPLAIRWGRKLQPGRRVDDFINVADLGPTFLQLAGITPPKTMSMRGFRELLLGEKDPHSRQYAFIERERHADVRRDHQSYPIRAVRTRDYLYIRNLRPDRWPAGDPDVFFLHERPFGDVDTTAVKDVLLAHQKDASFQMYVSLIFAKRPAEELYDLRKDPGQLQNVAGVPNYAERLAGLRSLVQEWMKTTNDPRIDPRFDGFDAFRYYGTPPKGRQ